MAIFELLPDRIRPVTTTTFGSEGLRERGDLQRLLRDHVHVVAPDVLVIAEEFGSFEESRRRIDLLGLDKQANLVVIELKRTEDGGHMELQAVRYAAMVSAMTFDQVVDAHAAYLERAGREDDAREAILNFLDWDEPDEDEFAQDVRIVLASAEFSKELTTSVLWLNERGIDVRCVRIKPYNLDGRVLLDVQQIVPLPEAAEYQVQIREKQQRERATRRSSRDLTRYDVTVGGKTYRNQPKRWAMFRIVKHLTDSGVTPEAIITAIGFRQNRLFRSTEGELGPDEFIRRLRSVAENGGRAFSPRRWFVREDELIVSGGRTYAFTKGWGEETLLGMSRLAEAFPEHRIEFVPSGEGG